MQKKQYVVPRMEVLELETSQLMIVASGETSNSGTGEGSVSDETPDLAAGRRGTWGDLWS